MIYSNFTSNGVNGASPNLIKWITFKRYGKHQTNIEQVYLETGYFNYLQLDLIMAVNGTVNVQACNGDPSVASNWFTVPDGAITTSASQVFLDWAAYKYARIELASGTLTEAHIVLGRM